MVHASFIVDYSLCRGVVTMGKYLTSRQRKAEYREYRECMRILNTEKIIVEGRKTPKLTASVSFKRTVDNLS